MTAKGAEAGTTLATDVLLAGDILRVAHKGLPTLHSEDAAAALAELRAKHEAFRTFLNEPPNGNPLVNACLLYSSARRGFAGRHFLASRFAFAPLAGTALMASAVVAADQDWLSASNLSSPLCFETAAGPASVRLSLQSGVIGKATWVTRHPRLLLPEATIAFRGKKHLRFSLVSTGLPYIVVMEDDLGLQLDALSEIGAAARDLSALIGAAYPPERLGVSSDYARYLIMVARKVNDRQVRVVWVSDKGEVARSAGGTGALAVLAALCGKGIVPEGGTVAIEAPGGIFDTSIDEAGASVSATPKIVARHEFLHPPLA